MEEFAASVRAGLGTSPGALHRRPAPPAHLTVSAVLGIDLAVSRAPQETILCRDRRGPGRE
jgi:hypothetical protein